MKKQNITQGRQRVPFKNQLIDMKVPNELIRWAGNKTEAEFLNKCYRPDWLLLILEEKMKADDHRWPALKKVRVKLQICAALSTVFFIRAFRTKYEDLQSAVIKNQIRLHRQKAAA